MNPTLKRAFNRLLFDVGAVPYDLLTRHPVWHAHCREMLDHIPEVEGRPRVLLDLGCGPGVSAIQMKQARPNDQVIGLDRSALMLRRALAHRSLTGLDAELPLLQADACRLPLRTASVDAITGHSFLYLVPHRAETLAEMHRVLRPGGAVVLLEPQEGTRIDALVKLRNTPSFALTMSLWRLASGAAGRFTAESLERTLSEAGFRSVSAEPTLEGLGLIGRGIRP